MMQWTTACPDWEERILSGRSLIPFDPLFPAQAEAALDIFRGLHLVDVAGSPTMGEACRDWIFDFVSAVFGAYDEETGRRLIRYFLLHIAKKNGKSTTAAGMMLTALLRNWRESGEYYILAPTKEIADNSFFPARDMVQADDNLRALLHVQPNHRIITHRNTGAFLKVVAADSETVAGKKTIGLLVDELWLFGKRAGSANMLREAMGGLASRPEGFVIYLTTQSDSAPDGVFKQILTEFRDIRDGKVIEPKSLGVLYEFPESMIQSGAYKLPENWYIPNPSLGAGVDNEFLLEMEAKSQREGRSSYVGFLAKHLNVQVSQAMGAGSWAGATVWDRGIDRTLTLDTLLERSEVVTVGIDGGGHDDLLGIGVIGREKGTKRWLGWSHALISDIGLERRKANADKYEEFARDGDLTKFVYRLPEDGAPIETPEFISYIVSLVQRIQSLGLLAQVGVDPYGMGAIVDALADIGVSQENKMLDGVRQGIALMPDIKTIEIKLADGSFRHGGSAMLAWCAGNAFVVSTPTAMRIARDESGYGKIDPLMALFDAAHLMSLNPEAAGSIYEERGLLVI